MGIMGWIFLYTFLIWTGFYGLDPGHFRPFARPTRESSDRDSLLAFRSKISKDPLGILNSWNESTHFCNWSGVTCSRRHPTRVTKLDLQSQKLEGTLSPHIGNLSFLRTLNLQKNKFSSEIPQTLGALSRLQGLGLGNNSFSGEIPTSISRCSNLQILYMPGNKLGGELPSALGLLSELQALDLGSNNFAGKIPPSFGNLSSLTWISLTSNNLYGNIPSTLGQLKNLQVLSLGVNKLSGPIPTSLYNLSSLIFLSLGVNKLIGSLPYDIGLTLPKLETLSLHNNQFRGHIPATIANLTLLKSFSIARNGFTGKVPYLDALRDLEILVVSENSLGYGENDDLNFLSSLLNCTHLEQLGLNDNNLGGMMPDFLSNFSTKITRLTLGRNKIRGRIPSDIGNLISLEILGMEENMLTGPIPSSTAKLQNLFILTVIRNKLSGQIPSSIGNLSSINVLGLNENSLQGSIPPSIGECANLQFIHLKHNNLSGSIPKVLFGIPTSIQIDLSENMLTGLLPSEVGKLMNLNYLDVSENSLSGEIPPALGGCTSLEELYLEGNLFNGQIPASMNSLRGIWALDLSRNNLSGQVPAYFENFALSYLNLSWNDFEGQLPDQRVFNNVSAISVMGNKKLCGGVPELHLPSCTSKKFKLKLILSLIGAVAGVILVSSVIFIYLSRKKRKQAARNSSSIETSFPKASYDDLLKATNGFSPSNLLGVGGFGSVYKGVLGQERTEVAVKVLNLAKKGATKSFMAECEALRNIKHRNLVKIITACSSVDFKGNDFKALVYEFMTNGSLEDWLHPVHVNEREYLTFFQRFNIVVDVANALDYMHNGCQTPIAHCDLKPSNVLIDGDMVARVSDFGLARLCSEETSQLFSTQSSSIGIKGSIGYAAPEYGMGSEVSTSGDVYSFGILLLETFTGKRPTDSMFKDGLDLHSFAMTALPERVKLIADPTQFPSDDDDQFSSDKFWDCFISVVMLGVACSVESPRERMNVKKVAEELVHIRDNLLQKKAFVGLLRVGFLLAEGSGVAA